MLNGVEVTRSYARNAIRERKSEILNKLESGETEEKVQIGGAAYSEREWKKLMDDMDLAIDQIKEEQEQYLEMRDEQEAAKELADEAEEKRDDYVQQLYEKMTATGSAQEKTRGVALSQHMEGKRTAPYSALADENGVVTYNGVTFMCDYEHNALCLGDMTDESKVLNIPLEKGGSLKVNVNNLGDLSQAISMFSPEDIKRILSAIATYEKLQKTELEIEEDVNSIGESAERSLEKKEVSSL